MVNAHNAARRLNSIIIAKNATKKSLFVPEISTDQNTASRWMPRFTQEVAPIGRGSQICWAINAEKFPSGDDKHANYTHITLDGPVGDEIKRIRRKIANQKRKEKEK